MEPTGYGERVLYPTFLYYIILLDIILYSRFALSIDQLSQSRTFEINRDDVLNPSSISRTTFLSSAVGFNGADPSAIAGPA